MIQRNPKCNHECSYKREAKEETPKRGRRHDHRGRDWKHVARTQQMAYPPLQLGIYGVNFVFFFGGLLLFCLQVSPSFSSFNAISGRIPGREMSWAMAEIFPHRGGLSQKPANMPGPKENDSLAAASFVSPNYSFQFIRIYQITPSTFS